MERMTGLDASFLYLETPEQQMVINGIVHLDVSTVAEGYSFARMRSGLARRVKEIPPFRRKIYDSRLNVGHPAWVEDFDFDIDSHVKLIEMEPGADEDEFLTLCGELASTPLDRARPLWKAWFIERRRSGQDATVTVSVFYRVHHAVIDGMLGSELLSTLAATDASTPPQDSALIRTHVGNPNPVQLILGGVRDLIGRPAAFFRLLPETLGIPREMKRVREQVGSTESMPAPFTAPRTVFNRALTPRRALATATLDLAEVREVKDLLGGTINDVLLTVIGGAVQSYLQAYDTAPEAPMVAVVPMSIRADTPPTGANQVSAMFATLATDEPDPVERYNKIAASSAVAKKQAGSIRPALLENWGRMSPRSMLNAGMKAYEFLRLGDVHPVIYNFIISNVPGPKQPIYFLGARITRIHPFGPLLHGAGLSVTSLSFDNHLDLGVITCEHLLPDPTSVARGIETALEELLAAARAGAPTGTV
ncbi:wax ester/triacylglycerol synthase family O-acyltransferase [Dietzia sp. ANT_WB102]|uniref:WS/DGAT/MGAT family O-acyltransferase n=1 Tax=Dietzia sp. ANT_WB102 TaxID=2597345 RepID=UPI0011EF613E|nr:wax ester/triacylglycerol synthase family O-acyltransferase [Dietzia sp. ANT_WB102]KAA0916956.1 wax ester/triacylglycerol synthase family O-acyltransferase [Dietzia sp. ANT_WB102]